MIDLQRLAVGRMRLERRRALVDAEAAQPVALRDRPVDAAADAFRALPERFEIDMCGEIGLAGIAQRIAVSMFGTACRVSPRPYQAWP